MVFFEKIILYMQGKFEYGEVLDLNAENFAISEFSWHIEYDFLKEDHKNNFKYVNIGKKWQNFCL